MFDDSILSSLVKINSVPPKEKNIGEVLYKALSKIGFKVNFQDIGNGRKNIFAQKGKGEKAILFYGHMDTVPVGDEKQWKYPPFDLTEVNGKYYGLGTSDMKGGIATFLEVTKNTDAYVKIFLAVDEENISEGAWAAIQEKKDFFADIELIISAESCFNLSQNEVTVGRTGRCVYEVNFKGKKEHIIKYKEAEDAIEKMGRFIAKLYDDREEIFKSKDTVVQIRKVEGESVGMSVCDKALVEVEVLLGAGDTSESILNVLQKLTDAEIREKLRKTPYLQAYHFDSFPHQNELSKIIKKYTGKEMVLTTRKSVGDDNVLASLGIPVITLGPKGGNEHKVNEFVEIKSLEILQKIYEDFCNRLIKF